jgi:hypothetical protein
VDRSFMRDLPVYLTLGLGVVAAFLIYLVHRGRKPPPQILTAAAAFKTPPLPAMDGPEPELETDPSPEASGEEATAETNGKKAEDGDDPDKYRTAAE